MIFSLVRNSNPRTENRLIYLEYTLRRYFRGSANIVGNCLAWSLSDEFNDRFKPDFCDLPISSEIRMETVVQQVFFTEVRIHIDKPDLTPLGSTGIDDTDDLGVVVFYLFRNRRFGLGKNGWD